MSSQNPHDALFRRVFSRSENAVGELRAVLPEALSAQVDWASLRLVDGRFVDPKLGDRSTDLLFTAGIGGREAFVYLLLEHQSTVDALMPLRLLRYMMRIWDRWLVENPGARRVPVIVPVMLYHGEEARGWSGPRSMQALLDLDEAALAAVRDFVPGFDLLLDDLSCQDDEALRARTMQALAVLTLLLFNHARRQGDLLAKMLEWVDLLRQVLAAPDGLEALGLLLRYTMLVDERVTMQDIETTLVPAVGEELREVVMTEGQRLIEKGRVEGRIEGRVEGRVEGSAEGRAQALLTVLAARGVPVSDAIRERILACREIATLDGWIARAVTATAAADVVSEA